MKITVALIAILSISSTWSVEIKNEEPKDKREAGVGYPSQGLSALSYQAPIGQEGANSISIGAGYSVGGKPSYTFAADASGAPLQGFSSEGLQPSGHATIKLPPISLQPTHGLAANDLSQLMSQLSHSLNSGGLNLQPGGGFESYALAQPVQAEQHSAPQFSLARYTYEAPKLQQVSSFPDQPQVASPPSYAAGTKGLGSYSSTGPVLFTPTNSQANVGSLHSYGAAQSVGGSGGPAYTFSAAPSAGYSFSGVPTSGHSLGEGAIKLVSGHSLGGSGFSLGGGGHSTGGPGLSLGGSGYSIGGGGHSLEGAGHSLGGAGHSTGGSGLSLGGSGYSIGGAGHSLEGAGHSLGGAGLSLGGSGHSLGGSGHGVGAGYTLGGAGHSFGGLSLGSPTKSYGGLYKKLQSGKGSFKPSAFLGESVQGDSSDGLSSLSGSSFGHSPSFGHSSSSLGSLSHGSGLGGHGASHGGHGGSFGGSSNKYLSSYSPSKSIASYASNGHLSSGASAYSPGSSYGHSNSAYAASSASPQYYVSSSKHSPSSFGEGSSSFRSAGGHGALSSYSSGPKMSLGRVSQFYAPKDIEGSYSQHSYNTIKYSEELKPRAQ